MFVVHKTLRC